MRTPAPHTDAAGGLLADSRACPAASLSAEAENENVITVLITANVIPALRMPGVVQATSHCVPLARCLTTASVN